MRLHPRHALVVAAKLDIQRAVTEAIGRHHLTHAELAHILLDTALGWNRYAIHDEREDPQADTDGPQAHAGCNEKA